jgi:uncharacterized damage-inducible protein DinB
MKWTPDQLLFLFEYNLWADRRTLDACAALTDEQFTRDLGSSFGSVRDTLAHLYGAEWLWNERFQGRQPSGLPAAPALADLAAVRAKLEEMDRYFIDFISRLGSPELDRIIRYTNLVGESCADPLWQALHQLSNHATYHRGQVVTLLRQLGAKGVSTDLIRFYHERTEVGAPI